MLKRFLLTGIAIVLSLLLAANPAIADPSIPDTAVEEGWYLHPLGKPNAADQPYPVSMAVNPNDGATWISYFEDREFTLWVAHYVGTGGNCGSDYKYQCDEVGWQTGDGVYNSIAIYPGDGFFATDMTKVGVAYYSNVSGGSLYYGEYNCSGGLCSWATYLLLLGGYSGLEPSLTFDESGTPWIAFRRYVSGNSNQLWLAHLVGTGGNCGWGNWQCDTLLTGDFIGNHPSIHVSDNGDLRLLYYYDGNGDDLEHMWYLTGYPGDCGPSNEWHCVSIDTANDVGYHPSQIYEPQTGIGDGRYVAYYSYQNGGTIRLAYLVSLDGNCGNVGGINRWYCMDLTTEVGLPIGGEYGLVLTHDTQYHPVVLYYDTNGGPSGNGSLMIARRIADLDIPTGNCGMNDGSYQWQCETFDDGMRVGPPIVYQSVGRYADMEYFGWGDARAVYYNASLQQISIMMLDLDKVFLPAIVR